MPESVLREMVVIVIVEVAEDMTEAWEEEVVAASATSATGSVTLLESVARRRIAATSVTAPGTSLGIAARRRTPATTATW